MLIGTVLVMLEVFAGVSDVALQLVIAAPIAVQEMVLAVWLIVKGFNPSATWSSLLLIPLLARALRSRGMKIPSLMAWNRSAEISGLSSRWSGWVVTDHLSGKRRLSGCPGASALRAVEGRLACITPISKSRWSPCKVLVMKWEAEFNTEARRTRRNLRKISVNSVSSW